MIQIGNPKSNEESQRFVNFCATAESPIDFSFIFNQMLHGLVDSNQIYEHILTDKSPEKVNLRQLKEVMRDAEEQDQDKQQQPSDEDNIYAEN